MNYPTADMRSSNAVVSNFLNTLVRLELASRVDAADVFHEWAEYG